MLATLYSPISGSPDSLPRLSTSSAPGQPLNQLPTQTLPWSMSNPTFNQPKSSSTTTKSKPRKRVNTAEKRNQQNAMERARRETLNTKFLILAGLLPSLANCRRPSKSAIVNGSIKHLTLSREQRVLAANLLRDLCAERDELYKEVQEWRSASGCAMPDGMAPSGWTEEMEEVCGVEKEVFGTFNNMGGDGEAEGEEGDDAEYDGEMAVDQSASAGSAIYVSFNAPVQVHQPVLNASAQVPSQAGSEGHMHPVSALSSISTGNAHAPGPVDVNALPWSYEFAFTHLHENGMTTPSFNGASSLAASTSSTTLPFSAFMHSSTPTTVPTQVGLGVSHGQSSASGSPNSVSNFGAGTSILTPPRTADSLVPHDLTNSAMPPPQVGFSSGSSQAQTPSPRSNSSSSPNDKFTQPSLPAHTSSTAGSGPHGSQQWTPQQLLILQHMQQQRQQQQQQERQRQSLGYTSSGSRSSPGSFAGTPYPLSAPLQTPGQGQGQVPTQNPFEAMYQQQHQSQLQHQYSAQTLSQAQLNPYLSQQQHSPESFTTNLLSSIQSQSQSLPVSSPYLPTRSGSASVRGMPSSTPTGMLPDEHGHAGQMQEWRQAALAGYIAQAQAQANALSHNTASQHRGSGQGEEQGQRQGSEIELDVDVGMGSGVMRLPNGQIGTAPSGWHGVYIPGQVA